MKCEHVVIRLLSLTGWLCWLCPCNSFVVPTKSSFGKKVTRIATRASADPLILFDSSTPSKYVPIYEDRPMKKKPVHPRVGEVVRYYKLDGGKEDGELLVGKITFIQKQFGNPVEWLAEIVELENVGDGYFAEYSSIKRERKKTLCNLKDVSPIKANFVGRERAFLVPRDASGEPRIFAQNYDLESYEGPFSGPNAVNQELIQEGFLVYTKLKGDLFRNAAVAGLVGTLLCNTIRGQQDATIYFAGALAGLFYLFFLSIKTDTLASDQAKIGANISNLRFAAPLLVVVAVALYNRSLGDANPMDGKGLFSTVTPQQFGALTLGFLTYRVPLFADQFQKLIKDAGGSLLPGSAGVAMQVAQQQQDAIGSTQSTSSLANIDDSLTPVLVVSGPSVAGRTQLVEKLIAEGNGRFVAPKLISREENPEKFNLLELQGDVLSLDSTKQFGLTKDGILKAVPKIIKNIVDKDKKDKKSPIESVVVVDADVELAQKLQKIKGARLIGVWVSLSSKKKFENRIIEQLDSGELQLSGDQDREGFIVQKLSTAIKDIEFGITNRIFEFTILNEDTENSMKELRRAAEYAFK